MPIPVKRYEGRTVSRGSVRWKKKAATYRAKSNSGGGQTYQASISCMRLMNGICIVVTKLVEDGLDPLVVF